MHVSEHSASVETTPAQARPDAALVRQSIRRWIALFLLSLAYFFSLLDRQILTVLVDPIQADLGISDTQFGLLQGFAFAIFYTGFGIPLAVLADRWKRNIIIATGVFVWSACTVLAGFARSFGLLFGARIGVGVGEAALAPAGYSMMADMYDRKHLGRAIGVFHTFGALGIGAAPILGGALYAYFAARDPVVMLGQSMSAWGMVLVSVGMPGCVLGILIYLCIREPARRALAGTQAVQPDIRTSRRPEAVNAILADRGYFLRFLIACALLSITGQGFITWAPAWFMRVFEMAPGQAGVSVGVSMLIGSLVGPLAGGALSDLLLPRVGNRAPIIMLSLCALGTLLVAIALPFATAPAFGMVLVVLISIFFTAILALGASAIQLGVVSTVRAQVSAVWLCLNTLVGLGLGSLLIGMVTDNVFGYPGAVGYSIGLVAALSTAAGLALMTPLAFVRRDDPTG